MPLIQTDPAHVSFCHNYRYVNMSPILAPTDEPYHCLNWFRLKRSNWKALCAMCWCTTCCERRVGAAAPPKETTATTATTARVRSRVATSMLGLQRARRQWRRAGEARGERDITRVGECFKGFGVLREPCEEQNKMSEWKREEISGSLRKGCD